MADTYPNFNERIGGQSPHTAGFTRRGDGRSIMKFVLGDKGDGSNAITTRPQLHAIVQEILGFTTKHTDGKRLRRVLPKCDPLWPWLFAQRVSEIRGLGRMTQSATGLTALEAPSFDNVSFYPTYECTIEFAPLPYPVVDDSSIETGSLIAWTKPDGTTSSPSYAKEWLRYTDFEKVPAAEYIAAQTGQFVFDAGVDDVSPDGQPAGTGQIQMLKGKTAVIATWYEVPYDYVHKPGVTSYIEQGLGHINQNDWNGFDAGTLLFEGVRIQRYTPPVPSVVNFMGNGPLASEKLCDISFMFLFVDPPLGKDASGATATPRAPANANVIQAGHNLVPFAHTGMWYFAKTQVADFANADGRGIFPSFPVELLWTNPGV